MNLEQIRTVLWLRWRLTANQINRQGKIWALIVVILFWLAMITSFCSFFGAISLGYFLRDRIGAYEWMFLFDALVLAFISMWMFGLLVEIQQSELLSLHRLLHLPISLGGTFLCNYLTSLISLTIVFLVPVMSGFAVALILTQGWRMLVVPLLIASFVLLISTVTYQFQGWLATMMLNPRRRRAVIATLSLIVIVGAQLPNLVNIFFQRSMWKGFDTQKAEMAFTQSFNQRVAEGTAKPENYQRELQTAKERFEQRKQFERTRIYGRIRAIGETINAALPVTWLPYGVKAAAEGRLLPGLFGTIGAVLISVVSLRRSYRTAMRHYTGQLSAGSLATSAPRSATEKPPVRTAAGNLIERSWPFLSEQAAAVAWTNVRSLTRSPEMRLLLIAPLLAPIIIGGLLYAQGSASIPVVFRPLICLGAIAVPMMALAQLLQNQFGADRAGFRAMVLTSIPRREILLAKNFSLAPLMLGIGVSILLLMQFMLRMPVVHLLALIMQLIATYILYCICGNMVSIWFPTAMASGSMKPASANSRVVLAQVIFGLLFPFMWLPGIAAYGIHALVEMYVGPSVPTFLMLSVLQFGLIAFAYRWVLRWQGRKLQEREQTILQAIVLRSE